MTKEEPQEAITRTLTEIQMLQEQVVMTTEPRGRRKQLARLKELR